jgi:hypothetical protein
MLFDNRTTRPTKLTPVKRQARRRALVAKAAPDPAPPVEGPTGLSLDEALDRSLATGQCNFTWSDVR